LRFDYYNSETGEIREFVFRADDAPGYSWRDVDGVEWRRVWNIPHAVTKTKASEVSHRGQELPISHSLPIDKREGKLVRRGDHVVREHSDGTHSTLRGDRIIDNPKSADTHAKLCGYTRE
jgi:hypothetical protein